MVVKTKLCVASTADATVQAAEATVPRVQRRKSRCRRSIDRKQYMRYLTIEINRINSGQPYDQDFRDKPA